MSAEDITFEEVLTVTHSWDKVKRLPNYEPQFGKLLFEKLFEIEPRSLGPLNFHAGESVDEHPSFSTLAHIMVDMVDLAVGFLGPDLDPLADDLLALGRRHVNYGVEPEYFAGMAVALVCSLHTILSDFTSQDESAWTKVFCFLIAHMSQGLRQAQAERRHVNSVNGSNGDKRRTSLELAFAKAVAPC